MRDIDQQLQNLCANDNISLCYIVRIIQRDGDVIRLTGIGDDLVVPNDGTYLSNPGVQVGSITHYADGSASTCDLEVPVDYGSTITRVGIREGLYRGAKVEIDIVDYEHLDVPGMRVMTGEIAGINYTDGSLCSFAVTGSWDTTSHISTWTYSKTCNNRLGDRWCKVPVVPDDLQRSAFYNEGDYVRHTFSGTTIGYFNRIFRALNSGTTGSGDPNLDYVLDAETVDGDVTWIAEQSWIRTAEISAIPNIRTFDLQIEEPRLVDGWFDGGTMIFYTEESNVQHIYEVRRSVGKRVILWLPPRFPVDVGHRVQIFPGCNKTMDDCAKKFANFRPGGGLGIQAFPHAPDENFPWSGYEEEVV